MKSLAYQDAEQVVRSTPNYQFPKVSFAPRRKRTMRTFDPLPELVTPCTLCLPIVFAVGEHLLLFAQRLQESALRPGEGARFRCKLLKIQTLKCSLNRESGAKRAML
jgi:hypothetical protein